MQILPVDLTSLVATVLGISVVLIPVIGITARFALKPTVEALGRLFENRGIDDTIHILERRIDLQESQIESLRNSIRQLSDAREFDRQLSAPAATDAAPAD